jgi:hypothetical protein
MIRDKYRIRCVKEFKYRIIMWNEGVGLTITKCSILILASIKNDPVLQETTAFYKNLFYIKIFFSV